MTKLFMMLALCCGVMTANAQREVGTLTLQPKVGVTAATLTDCEVPDADEIDSQLLFGAVAGVEAEYQLTPMISLAAGVNYAMQGIGFDDFEYSESGFKAGIKDAKVSMNYINVPITANFYLFKGFALKAGIQLGFVADAKMKYTTYGNIPDTDFDGETEHEQDIKDTKMDISIPIGLSYEYDNFVFDARYNLGISKVADGVDYKNRVLQLTVGYKFDM